MINSILQRTINLHPRNFQKPFNNIMERFGPLLLEYFERMGFEDPYLEVITLSALIEGFGILMIYAYPAIKFPAELLDKFENRIIEMYI